MSLHGDRHDPSREAHRRLDVGDPRNPHARPSHSHSPQRFDALGEPHASSYTMASAMPRKPALAHWPPSPSVEEESLSVSKEYQPPSVRLPSDDVRSRGSIDQQPVIMNADGSDSWDADSSADSVSSEPRTPVDSESNRDKRFVLLPKGQGFQSEQDDEVSNTKIQIKKKRMQRKAAVHSEEERSRSNRTMESTMNGQPEPMRMERKPSPYAFSAKSSKGAPTKDAQNSYEAVPQRSSKFPHNDRFLSGQAPDARVSRGERPGDMRRNASSSHVDTSHRDPFDKHASYRKQASHSDLRSPTQGDQQFPRPSSSESRAGTPKAPPSTQTRRSRDSALEDSTTSESDLSPDEVPRVRRPKSNSRYSFTASLLPQQNSSSGFEIPKLPPRPHGTSVHTPVASLQPDNKPGTFNRSNSNSSQRSSRDARDGTGIPGRTPSKISPLTSPAATTPTAQTNRFSWDSSGNASQRSSRPTTPTSPNVFVGSGKLHHPSLPALSQSGDPNGNQFHRSSAPNIPPQPLPIRPLHRERSSSGSYGESKHHHHSDAHQRDPTHSLPPTSVPVSYQHRSVNVNANAASAYPNGTTTHPQTAHHHHHGSHGHHATSHDHRGSKDGTFNELGGSVKHSHAIPTASTFPIERPSTQLGNTERPPEVPSRSATVPSKKISSQNRTRSLPSLPVCLRPYPTRGLNDWSTLQGHTYLDICPNCKKGLEDAGFKGRFLASPPRPGPEATKCDMSVPWVRMAWLLVLQSEDHNTELVNQMTRTFQHEAPCPGKDGAVRIWYGLVDPESDRYVSNFDACQNCIKCLQLILPNLRGAFLQRRPNSINPERNCDLRTDSRRYPQYVDLLEHISNQAFEYRREPNIRPFVDLAKHLTSVAECRQDDQLVEAPWHFMPQLPDFTVCEECYEDVVLPRAKAGSELAAQFHRNPRLITHDSRPVSCQLYSLQMRDIFRDSTNRNDFHGLKAVALQRVSKERELQARHAQIITWPEEQRVKEGARLIAEWKRWA